MKLFEWGGGPSRRGDSAESFLGVQGYMWDTQSDIGDGVGRSGALSDNLESACTTSSYKLLFPEGRSCVERDDRKEVYPRKQMT